MPLFRTCPFEELVLRCTDENNVNDDWALIMEIVDKTVNYDDGPKLILQAITKRLYSSIPRVVVQALMLLDACVKNCGRRFHLEVSSRNFVAEIRKILQKMNPAVINKFKTLIKRWAEVDFKDDAELGLIPSLYYKLKSEGIQFPDEPESKPAPPPCTNPDAVSSQEEEEDIVKAIALSLKETKGIGTSSSLYDLKEFKEPVKVELLKARALYDFDAVEDNELTIKAGEIIVVTDKSNESWWKGSNQRGEGYFPVSFVTEDLDAPIELLNFVPESSSEAEEAKVEEKPVEVNEKKIQLALQLLNDIDPTDDYSDEKELLDLERECYAMSPLIDEKLQEIDKKCTVLNSLNDEIMKAIQTFYKLTRDSIVPAQFGYYYNLSPEGVLINQPMQVPGSSHAGAAVNTQSMPKSGIPGNFYIPPNFLPNLTPLTTNQIRQNVVNLPFIHPQYLPMHYNMLPQKLNTDVNYAVPGPSQSSEYISAMPQNQVVTEPNIEDSKNNLPNHSDQNTLGNKNQLTLLDTENFTSMLPQDSSVLPDQNVPSSTASMNNFHANGQSNELSSLPVQNYVTQVPTLSSVATNVIEHSQNVSMNGHAIPTTNYPSSESVSMSVSSERLAENSVMNQNGH